MKTKSPYRNNKRQQEQGKKRSQDKNKVLALGVTATAVSLTGIGADVQTAEASGLATTIQVADVQQLIGNVDIAIYEVLEGVKQDTALVESGEGTYDLDEGKYIVEVIGNATDDTANYDALALDVSAGSEKTVSVTPLESTKLVSYDSIIKNATDKGFALEDVIVTNVVGFGDVKYVAFNKADKGADGTVTVEELENTVTVGGKVVAELGYQAVTADGDDSTFKVHSATITYDTEVINGTEYATLEGVQAVVTNDGEQNNVEQTGEHTYTVNGAAITEGKVTKVAPTDVINVKTVNYGDIGTVVKVLGEGGAYVYEYTAKALDESEYQDKVAVDGELQAGENEYTLKNKTNGKEVTVNTVNGVDYLNISVGEYTVTSPVLGVVGTLIVAQDGTSAFTGTLTKSATGFVLEDDMKATLPEGASKITDSDGNEVVTSAAFGYTYYTMPNGKYAVTGTASETRTTEEQPLGTLTVLDGVLSFEAYVEPPTYAPLVVTAKNSNGDDLTGVKVEYKDADGTYKEIPETGLTVGNDYVIRVSAEGYVSEEYEITVASETGIKIEAVLAPETNRVDFKDVKFDVKEKGATTPVTATLTIKQDGVDVTKTVTENGYEYGVDYEVTVTAEGYKSATVEFKLETTTDLTEAIKVELEKAKDKDEGTGEVTDDIFGLGDITSIDKVEVVNKSTGEYETVTPKDGVYTIEGITKVSYTDKDGAAKVAEYVAKDGKVNAVISKVTAEDLLKPTAYGLKSDETVRIVGLTELGLESYKGDVYLTKDGSHQLGVAIDKQTVQGKEMVERFPVILDTVTADGVTVSTAKLDAGGVSVLTHLGYPTSNLKDVEIKSTDGKSQLEVKGDKDTVNVTADDLGKAYKATLDPEGAVVFYVYGTVENPQVAAMDTTNAGTLTTDALAKVEKHGLTDDQISKLTVKVEFEDSAEALATDIDNILHVSRNAVDKVAKITLVDADGKAVVEAKGTYKQTDKEGAATFGFDITEAKLASKETPTTGGNFVENLDISALESVTDDEDNMFVANIELKDGVNIDDLTIKVFKGSKGYDAEIVTVKGKHKVVLKDTKENKKLLTEGVHDLTIEIEDSSATDELHVTRTLINEKSMKKYKDYLKMLTDESVPSLKGYEYLYFMATTKDKLTQSDVDKYTKAFEKEFEDHEELLDKLLEDLEDLAGKKSTGTADPDKSKVKEHKMTLDKLKKDYGKSLPKEVTQELVDKYYDLLVHNIDKELVDDNDHRTEIIVEFLENVHLIIALEDEGLEALDELFQYLHEDADLLEELYVVQDTVILLQDIADDEEVDESEIKDYLTELGKNKIDKYLTKEIENNLKAYKGAEELDSLSREKGITSIGVITKDLKSVTNKDLKKIIDKLVKDYVDKHKITDEEIKKAVADAGLSDISVGDKYKVTTNNGVITVTTDLKAADTKIDVAFKLSDLQNLVDTKHTKVVIKTADGLEIQVDVQKLDLASLKTSLGDKAVVYMTFEKVSGGVSFTMTAKNDKDTKAITNFGSFTKIIMPNALIGVERGNNSSSKTRVFRKSDSGNIAVLGKMVGDKYELFTQYGGTFIAGEPVVKKAISDLENFYNAKGMQDFVERGILVMDTEDKFTPNRAMTTTEVKRSLVVSLADGNDASIKDVLGSSIEEYLTKETGELVATGDVLSRQNTAILMHKLIERYDESVLTKVADSKGTTGSNGKKQLADPVYNDTNEIATTAKQATSYMQHLGIMTGKPGSFFDPNGSLTKSEFTKVLGVTLNRLGYLDNESIYSGK